MNKLQTIVATAIASSALAGGLATAQEQPALTDDEKATVEAVIKIRECANKAFATITEEDFAAEVSSLKEQYATEIENFRQQIKEQNPDATDEQIEQYIEEELSRDAQTGISSKIVETCAEEAGITLDEIESKAAEVANKYGPGVFQP